MLLDFFTKHRTQIGLLSVVFFGYLFTALIGLAIHPVNTFATLIWPPTGIALAAFILYGYRFWPTVMLAAFLVNLYTGAPLLAAAGIAVGNTLAPLCAAYVLKEYVGFKPSILRLRDNIAIVLAAFFATMISASIGVASLWLDGALRSSQLQTTWQAWWVGDMLGILIFAPLILKWFRKPLFERTRLQYLEMTAALTSVVGVSILIFWTSQTHFAYFIFIPLVWAALRTGPRGTTLAIFLSASIATAGTLLGYGPFASQGLLYLQIFEGTISGLMLIFMAAVEERRYALETIKKHVSGLETALHKISSDDEAKKEFLAVLAHELRNPLSAILSSTELLKLQGMYRDDSQDILQTIDERARAMGSLLDDLLDVSRISKKKLKLQKEPVSLGSLMERSVRSVQGIMQSRGHTLSVHKPEKEIFLEADPIRLEQIIVNLLSNASKYTEPGGSVELSASREAHAAVIVVRDSGIGIPKNVLTRIFEPFFQVDHGKMPYEGLGIGLSLTRQLVELHGGTITASSKGAGRGSEFVVRLPLPLRVQTPAAPRNILNGGRALRRSKNILKILIVDDNRETADAFTHLLEMRGHVVVVAYNGSDALEKARHFLPEVVLLDIGLPDMDGYTVARRIRGEVNSQAFLIALTGYGQEEDKIKARQAGFDHHLIKPVGLKEIEQILRRMPAAGTSRRDAMIFHPRVQ